MSLPRALLAFTLLLSPNCFDFGKSVKVVANGKVVFDAIVKKDLKTLMKWAAQNNDRTMLYAVEVKITLPVK